MRELLVVNNIYKSFKISKKQQRIEKTNLTIKKAVNDISFKVYEGEIYGLLGPNGAGKTTTLRIMSTLIKPDSGDVLIDGHSVVKEPNVVRNSIGFLTSELKLEDFFTPNYLFDFFGKLHNMTEEEIKNRKDFLFSKFGIDKFKEVKVGELSTGMKQKVSIVISLVHNPSIVIFDEPTNGLDVLTAKIVTDYLQELKNEGKTIIVSTHIFSLVETICDRVGIVINGKLVKDAVVKDLTSERNLEDVFFDIYKETVGEE